MSCRSLEQALLPKTVAEACTNYRKLCICDGRSFRNSWEIVVIVENEPARLDLVLVNFLIKRIVNLFCASVRQWRM